MGFTNALVAGILVVSHVIEELFAPHTGGEPFIALRAYQLKTITRVHFFGVIFRMTNPLPKYFKANTLLSFFYRILWDISTNKTFNNMKT